jgi:hypothetical protein
MRIIVTDKLARRQRNFRVMVEIEMPCCGNAVRIEELTDVVSCESCNVSLELGDTHPGALPVAA